MVGRSRGKCGCSNEHSFYLCAAGWLHTHLSLTSFPPSTQNLTSCSKESDAQNEPESDKPPFTQQRINSLQAIQNDCLANSQQLPDFPAKVVQTDQDKLLDKQGFLKAAAFSFAVIEVASGEYGDLNPLLFQAVQNGLCAMEEKKSSPTKADSSCPGHCVAVSWGEAGKGVGSGCLFYDSRIPVYTLRPRDFSPYLSPHQSTIISSNTHAGEGHVADITITIKSTENQICH